MRQVVKKRSISEERRDDPTMAALRNFNDCRREKDGSSDRKSGSLAWVEVRVLRVKSSYDFESDVRAHRMADEDHVVKGGISLSRSML